ncbi:MAG: hypothetical protein EHM41_01605 [Chloroflexi bacterium]|nr:MAG: hypothetical protein EHM41_01605 [Chloroflexota bacterium]
MQALLGVDIGTSAAKAALFSLQGCLLSSARVPHVLSSPLPGWAEQDPDDWRNGVNAAIRQVLESTQDVEVAAVGLSGQCPGHLLVDEDGDPIGSAIIWRDIRAQAESEWICKHISPEDAAAWTGSSSIGSPTLPPARLLWLKAHRPEDWENCAYVLEPKDFIALHLTGRAATDANTAYCLIHPETSTYDPEFMRILGVEIDKLPVVLQPTQFIGEITHQAASQTGLRPGTPVVAGTIDAYCDSIAGGALQPGQAVDVAGTSEIVSLGTDGLVQSSGVFLASVVKDGQFICGPSQAGGDTLHWLAKVFYPGQSFPDALPQIEAEAGSVPPGCEGLVFVPYLHGARAPLWNTNIRGSFLRVDAGHQRAHFSRAVYEGVAFEVRHILEACELAYGKQAESITLCGGGSASQLWNKIKAGVLERDLYPSAVRDTACLGAAILAAAAAGFYPNVRLASQEMVRRLPQVEPEPGSFEIYSDNYRVYQSYHKFFASE